MCVTFFAISQRICVHVIVNILTLVRKSDCLSLKLIDFDYFMIGVQTDDLNTASQFSVRFVLIQEH